MNSVVRSKGKRISESELYLEWLSTGTDISWPEAKRRSKGKFLRGAIKRPGRVKRFLMRKFGKMAFTKSGTIKVEFLNKAIKDVRARTVSRRPKGLLNALVLAKRLKKGI